MLVFWGRKEKGGGGNRHVPRTWFLGKLWFFLKSFTTTNSPAPPHFPLPSVKTSSPAATEQGGVRELSGNLCVAFSPRERRGGCHAGEEGADRRDVSNRALLSSACLFILIALALFLCYCSGKCWKRGNRRGTFTKTLGLGFFNAEIL